MSSRRVHIDGTEVLLEADATASLADAARRAGASRIVVGCTDGRCGACRALVDGALVSTCKLAVEDVREGATILTAASLEDGVAAREALSAFAHERPTRCRMCTGGLAVTAHVLARDLARGEPREAATEALLVDATCMCTGRGSWRRALAVVE